MEWIDGKADGEGLRRKEWNGGDRGEESEMGEIERERKRF